MSYTSKSGRDPEYKPHAGPLYHYTSIDGLLGIVESKSLRATSVHYLNDASEAELGMGLIRKTVIDDLKVAQGIDRDILVFLLPYLEMDLLQYPSVFVVCFSEHKNHLSQWRGYTPHG